MTSNPKNKPTKITYNGFTVTKPLGTKLASGVKYKCDNCGITWPAFTVASLNSKKSSLNSFNLTHPIECTKGGCPSCDPKARRKKLKRPPPFKKPDTKWNPALSPGDYAVEIYPAFQLNTDSIRLVIKNLDDYLDHYEDLWMKRKSITVRNSDGACIPVKEFTTYFDNLYKERCKKADFELGKKAISFNSTAVGKSPRLTVFTPNPEPEPFIEPEPSKLEDLAVLINDKLGQINKLVKLDDSLQSLTVTSSPFEKEYWDYYHRLESKGIPPNVSTLWHGTSVENLIKILSFGFKLPTGDRVNGLSFGPGIYFGQREKAETFARKMSYMTTGLTIVNTNGKHTKIVKDINSKKETPKREKQLIDKLGVDSINNVCNQQLIIEADVCLGKSLNADEISKDFAKHVDGKHFHSIFCDRFKKGDEWVVFNPHQILIRKIIRIPEIDLTQEIAGMYTPGSPQNSLLASQGLNPITLNGFNYYGSKKKHRYGFLPQNNNVKNHK